MQIGAGAVSSADRGVGPKLGGVVGVEWQPFTQVGLRLEGEPSVWWLSADGSTSARFGIAGTLALLVRL